MGRDYPSVYRYSAEDARRSDELKQHARSLQQNASCACAIESSIRDCLTEDGLKEGCADAVLKRHGFKRVNFVLANSLQEMGDSASIREDVRAWVRRTYVPEDGGNNRYYAVDTDAKLLEAFAAQVRDAYMALGLFGAEHCVEGRSGLDYTGKVLVLSPDAIKENYWQVENMLWEANTGFGCSPTARGRAVYATCLGDGERARWDRNDFLGVLDDQFLPDWAREKLEELHAPQQDGPSMGGMG